MLAYLRAIGAKLMRHDELVNDLEEELASHIAHRADDLERTGLSRGEAERQARVEFGARERFKEESYTALGGSVFEVLVRDMRLAMRVLRKSKGFTVTAILTLTLAIGANAVVFGIADALLLRPLQVPQEETLYGTHYGDGSGFQSYPNYIDLRDRNRSFEDVACFNFAFAGFDPGHDPSNSMGFAVSGNYFDVLRVQPRLGRLLHASDERGQNSAPYVVLSYAYWHSRFHGDAGVIGRDVQIDKHPFTVVGVAPEEFRGTLLFLSPDFYVPIVNQQQVGAGNALSERGNIQGVFEVFGHLRPGVTVGEAEADVNAIGGALAKSYPKEMRHQKTTLGKVGLTAFSGPIHAFVAGLILLSLLILLAACANLGSLFAAHTADRSREVALRLALGATRSRILRQLLTEAVLIACVGGALGLWCSMSLLKSLSAWQPFQGAPIHIPVTLDARNFVVAALLALLSGLLFGIVPMRQVMRANPYGVVKGGWSPTARHGLPVRDVLLVVQIAICAILLTASMVAVSGLLRSLRSQFGFDPRHTLVLGVDLSMGGYSGDNRLTTQRQIITAMTEIPGVESAGLVNNYPPLVYTAAFRVNAYKDDGRELQQSNVVATPYAYDVSPGYFEAAGTQLLAGRSFTWHDDKSAQRVAIANKEYAVKMFGSVEKALGSFYRDQHGEPDPGCWYCRRRKVSEPDGEPAASGIPAVPAIACEPCARRGAVQWRSRCAGSGHAGQAPRDRCGIAGRSSDVGQPSDGCSVSRTRGQYGAVRARHHRRPPVYHGHVRHGGLLGEQEDEGTGNSHRAGRTAIGSVERSRGTRNPASRNRLGCRRDPGDAGEPGAVLHRVSSQCARSGCACGRDRGYGSARAARYLDSCTACALGRSARSSARRLNRCSWLSGRLEDTCALKRCARKEKHFHVPTCLHCFCGSHRAVPL